MYDINTKNIKKGMNFYLIFLVVGVLFFVIMVGIMISNRRHLARLDSTTMSKSVEVESHLNSDGDDYLYSAIYHYRVNGVEYSCSSKTSSSVDPGTQNKTVYYDSKNPSDCMTEEDKSINVILLIFIIIPILCIASFIINSIKTSKRLKVIKVLNQKGKLIKNIPYRLVETGIRVNDRIIYKPVIDYTLPSGSVVVLQGEPRFDNKTMDADGMVDLVIDESNPDNYFIDFEINRLSGNLPEDYFNQGQVTSTVQNQQVVQANPYNQITPPEQNQNINNNINNNNMQN